MRGQWKYSEPEWFDHRHHLLYPERYFNDYWTISANNIISVLPQQAKLLEMCCGDGFYDFYFYKDRCQEIIGVELNDDVYNQSVRLHSADNITYLHQSILDFTPQDNYFDTVSIRGAIEHFSEENQQVIFKKALKTLKVGGWFCGDTVANLEQEHSLLISHEHEWINEDQMRTELSRVFDHVETSTLISQNRTTLLWKCQKIK